MAKKKIIFSGVFLIIFFFVISKKVFSDLKINEIYPAPRLGDEEWVEIYNDGEKEIDLSIYSLSDIIGKKIIFATNSAAPFSFVLATASGVLNNTGPETIYLKDKNNNVLEIASYSSSFDASKSVIKCPDGNGNWYFSFFITKGYSNEQGCLILTPTLMPSFTPVPTSSSTVLPSPSFSPDETPTPFLVSYENIYLSEVMVNPKIGEKEWVEIYNDNDFLVELRNWYIDDIENAGSTPKSFTAILDKKSYKVVELSSSIFNNDGDWVRLLDFDRREKDSFEYLQSETGRSFGRSSFSSDSWCLQESSKGEKNNSCLKTTETGEIYINSFQNQFPTITKTKIILDNEIIDNLTKKTYKSSNPQTINLTKENGLTSGQVLGEETEDNKKTEDLLFLPLFQSILTNFLFLRRILKQISINP